MTRFALALVVAGLLAPALGCVRRTIHITSTPGGALVHLNDQALGRTPLTVPFKYYGKYDVRLQREGYQPLWTTADAAAPWWEYPGPDLVAEAIPGARSRIDWHFDLKPEAAPRDQSPAKLLDHARQMQALTDQSR